MYIFIDLQLRWSSLMFLPVCGSIFPIINFAGDSFPKPSAKHTKNKKTMVNHHFLWVNQL